MAPLESKIQFVDCLYRLREQLQTGAMSEDELDEVRLLLAWFLGYSAGRRQ